MLLAGLDGIEKQTDPTALHLGPYTGDIEKLPEKIVRRIPVLPTSLSEAFAALRRGSDFLTRDSVFPPAFVETFCSYKEKNEAEALRRLPHPKEFELYYDC